MDTKRLLFLSLIRPIWAHAADSYIRRTQVTQNRVLRMIANAPWYVRNSVLLSDMDIPYVTDAIKELYESMNRSMTGHANPLITAIPENPPPPRNSRRLKRKYPQDSIVELNHSS
ncbi:Hypothetical protein NTJ_09061 [Nesidiocoris tenuis]|uniref:RNA-directed DNA polymerase from transposon X-element n=1 Tax=Nesidiocoris tenuis TaxID=355587 RepID=A0ABN7AVP0_9HEMI|nr:Hypothetical protein NTJ_09061 [Nesidiocoris tenuis]